MANQRNKASLVQHLADLFKENSIHVVQCEADADPIIVMESITASMKSSVVVSLIFYPYNRMR